MWIVEKVEGIGNTCGLQYSLFRYRGGGGGGGGDGKSVIIRRNGVIKRN